MTAEATLRSRVAAAVAAPFGGIEVESDGEWITGLRFVAQPRPIEPVHELAERAARQLATYLADPRVEFDLPLKIRGTEFQRQVWGAIASIPCGSTRSYGAIAIELDAPARAVGQACGDNRLPVVIPCHRVIGATGIGGFAHSRDGFELAVKRWLLEHEDALRGSLL
ncbi:MAG TPA: methylated-DNA--[protein]-cysteine S-methyltransferase [Burkholderiaceae bacterium]|nr:methylated-DNA--[protein]-cysteine S-methyltransferase [Burkholderiaceae bacterium]